MKKILRNLVFQEKSEQSKHSLCAHAYTHISNHFLYLAHSKITPERADDQETCDKKMYDNKTFFVCLSLTHTHTFPGVFTQTQLLKHCYLVSPAHHRKPHVAAARQRRPDQFAPGRPHTQMHTPPFIPERALQPANMHRQVQNLQITPAGSNPFS